ncbi:MAG: geranyl transferase [Gammaproteobacteria bacterium]|nr:MAG: geranyl transferase [Gammaproteobacteria bacterium]
MSLSEQHVRFDALQQRIEEVLDQWLPPADHNPGRLHESMRYSVLGGGKRVRPLLVYAAAEATGARPERVDGCAAAVELVHVYSLIHDDLPAMDDDDLRRGKPTNHKAFDEATAILAGDALQALAFHILAVDPQLPESAATRIEMIRILAEAAGSRGMAGGQAIDLAATGRSLTLPELEEMHVRKTGALIHASVLMGALGGAERGDARLQALHRFAHDIGLAFQIQDDILDETGDTEQLGKQAGADRALNKPTYPAVIGLDASREEVELLHDRALQALEDFGPEADLLRAVGDWIVQRTH